MNTVDKISSSYTARQEFVHSIIHAFGILFGIIGFVFLITNYSESGYSTSFIAKCIYGFCFLITFLFSTLYHSIHKERLKHLFKILDHISIYFLIAGTYTPFVLIYMHNTRGFWLLSFVWGGALIGIIFKIFFIDKSKVVSVFFYVFLGLLFLFDAKNFFTHIPINISWLIIAGVILYLVGIIFYLQKGWKYHHAIWHLFSLAASIFHFVAIFFL